MGKSFPLWLDFLMQCWHFLNSPMNFVHFLYSMIDLVLKFDWSEESASTFGVSMQLQNYREWCVQECVPLFPLPLLEFEMVEHKWIPHGIKTLIWYCHESNQHLYSASILKREKNGRIIHKVKKDFKKSIFKIIKNQCTGTQVCIEVTVILERN